MIAVNELAKV